MANETASSVSVYQSLRTCLSTKRSINPNDQAQRIPQTIPQNQTDSNPQSFKALSILPNTLCTLPLTVSRPPFAFLPGNAPSIKSNSYSSIARKVWIIEDGGNGTRFGKEYMSETESCRGVGRNESEDSRIWGPLSSSKT